MNSLISIITPTYNSARFIEKTISSVIAQTYKNWEMIIFDDGSIDNSVSIIEKYIKKDSRIKLYQSKTNKGATYSRNEAVKVATGKFIAFLDSDDLWMETKLKQQLTFMENNNYDFSYTQYCIIDENGSNVNRWLPKTKKVNYKCMLKTCSIGCLTVMLKKESFPDLKFPNSKFSQDYALWLKLLKDVEFAYCLNEKLGKYRIVSNSLSRDKIRKLKSQWDVYRNIEQLNFLFSCWNFCWYSIIGYLKNR